MTRVLGRYELLRPIARGGMAEVFLARRRGAAGVEKRLVIKRIRPEHATSGRLLELFVREARLSMALAHQNIVPVFDFGRAGDELFLAMEHVEGHDLSAALVRAGHRGEVMDPVLAAFVAAECCQALDYAHRRAGPDGRVLGVVHRDVTPRNVLLSSSGEVKLVDFGIASLAGEDAGRLLGTPAYMAPEQARGQEVDGRADLYSLGLVLFEAVTGQRARVTSHDDAAAVIATARRGELPPLPPGIPEPLARVIRRATTVAREDRYGDARAMAEALDGFIVGARAARPDLPAPSRRLVTWLRDLWPEGDDPPILPGDDFGPLPEGPAATFVDDGEAAVLGRETQRSIAITVGETKDAPAPAAEGKGASGAAASAASAAGAAPGAASGAVSGADATRRSRGTLIVIGLVLAATGVGVGLAARRSEAPPELTALAGAADASAPLPMLPAADAAPAQAPAADATPAAIPPADAAPAPPRPRPAADAAPAPPRPRPRADAAPTIAAPPRTLRRVTLGARPWARFTVDGERTVHETPETIELTPGKHTIHFENPEMGIRRDVVLDVPADRDLTHVENLLER